MSDATDQAEFRRKKIVEYDTLLGDIEVSYNDYGENQKEKIKRLAKILYESGHPRENICAKVCKDVSQFGIKERYVRQILPDEYKQKKFEGLVKSDINLSGGSSAASDEELEQHERNQPIAVTNDGRESVDKKAEAALDEIYGKTELQMKKEAQREIIEDKEETLENPNITNQSHPPTLLTNSTVEMRELMTEMESMKQTMDQLVEDRDHAISKHKEISKKYNLLKGGAKDEELIRLKVEVNNLRTILSDVDKQSLAKEGYKEIEVLKMESGTIRLLNEISSKAQRTFFLLVHPKTMQIKGARTDVQQHQIEAKRTAGVL